MKPEASDKKCESVQIILYSAYGKLCLHMCIFTYIDMHDHMHMDCPGGLCFYREYSAAQSQPFYSHTVQGVHTRSEISPKTADFSFFVSTPCK